VSFAPPAIASPGSGTSILTLTAAAGAASGASTLTLTATGRGVTKTVTLTVLPPGFMLTPLLRVFNVAAGRSAAMFDYRSEIGFQSAVPLSVSTPPKGVTATFVPATIVPPGNGTSKLDDFNSFGNRSRLLHLDGDGNRRRCHEDSVDQSDILMISSETPSGRQYAGKSKLVLRTPDRI
jgi:hypothetical protein